MSSTTSKVSLYKPAGGENVNVTTDLNNNWDKIDTNLNFRVVADTAARDAISPFWAGLNVRQTDNGKLYVSNGTAPISASWTEIVQTNNAVAGELWVDNLIRSTRATSGDSAYETRVTGLANAMWFVKSDGSTQWGPGAGAWDTNLYRSAANTLKTDDNLIVQGDLTTASNLVFSTNAAEKNADLSVSTTVANTTTETVIATYTIPANDMVAGATYKITAWGTAGVTGTPTITYKARIGGVAGSALGTTAFTASSGVTGKVWKSEIYLVCLTTGASGTVFANLHSTTGITVAGGNPVATPGTAMDGGSAVTVDTTASKDLVLTVTWGAASASNTCTARGYTAERVS